MSTQPLDIEPVGSDEEAATRAAQFKQVDPFPEIKPALLSAADIEDYARVTAMLHPFHAHPDSLKPASYEARPGRTFVRWDDDGNRIDIDVNRDGSYELPANSISFMQIEPKIRLPDYIAIRFNLRITHVHRGLLLGTGPLIDPGFSGDILIPLHNLTSGSYRIRGNEGLIWIEFTKTAPEIVRKADPPYARRGKFYPIEPHKTDRPIDYYFQRANDLQPIRSSIPEAVKNSAEQARQAAASAETAATAVRRAGLIYGGISIVAALAVVTTLIVGLHQYFVQVQANVQTTQSLASSIAVNSDRAKADAARAIADEQALKQDLDAARAQVEEVQRQLKVLSQKLDAPQPPAPSTLPPKQQHR